MIKNISDMITYIGVNDEDIDLFESQYKTYGGMSYNSYIINADRPIIVDSVDIRKKEEWLENVRQALNGKEPAYIVSTHIEEDHAGCLEEFLKIYKNTVLVGNEKTFEMFGQFFSLDIENRKLLVKENEEYVLGTKENEELKFTFYRAQMVHWPEVMFMYYQNEKTLFTADAFGRFGKIPEDSLIETSVESWLDSARRYYINICGKYGMQVNMILNKVSALEIDCICQLHGQIIKNDIEKYVNYYKTWASYKEEDQGTLIVYASIHGNTKEAAYYIYNELKEKSDKPVEIRDINRDDLSEVIALSYKHKNLIVLSVTYNMSLFPMMNLYQILLKEKAFQNRNVAIIENGSWAPAAGRLLKESFQSMKDINIISDIITIKSKMKEKDIENINKLIEKLL